MGVISQNGIDYPVPSVPVQSDGSATDLINDAVQTGQTIKSYLNSNFANLMVKQFFNQSTFTITFDYNASSSKNANGIMINANQGLFALLKLDLSPAVTKISGTATITISATNTKTYTITTSNTMWGNTTFIITHN